ncbi:MAG: putative lipid II flippase FtsW [Planctomycetaceae bacterium]|nr:putative lipid II flippase FtsW [Planctomycetaceae bacterium]
MSATPAPHPGAAFLACAGMLIAVGTLMVYSASITARPTEAEQIYLSRHLSFLALSLAAGGIAAHLSSEFWERWAPRLFLLTIALLIGVLLPGIGTQVNGAQRWIRLGVLSIQPSETAKLTLTLLLARLLTRSTTSDYSPVERRLFILFPVAISAMLVLIEPDLGTTVFLLLTATLVLFYSGWPLREFLIAGAMAVPAAAALFVLRPYQWRRIEGFIAAWTEPESAPYQVRQSLTTLGVGGFWGMGLGEGWQKLSFLPEANTDFVFAVIGEELGLLGTLSVVVLWGGLLYFGGQLIQRAPTGSFQKTVAATLLTQLALQAIINVGVVTAMLPPKGISHPFISYGGSSLLVSCVAVGLIISMTSVPHSVTASQEFGDEAEAASQQAALTAAA